MEDLLYVLFNIFGSSKFWLFTLGLAAGYLIGVSI